MDLFSFLATLILVTTVVTLVIALLAYVAYKIRERRRPKAKPGRTPRPGDAPIFLQPAATDALKKWRAPPEHGDPVQQAGQPSAPPAPGPGAPAPNSAGNAARNPDGPGTPS
jgi:hypothetical protein